VETASARLGGAHTLNYTFHQTTIQKWQISLENLATPMGAPYTKMKVRADTPLTREDFAVHPTQLYNNIAENLRVRQIRRKEARDQINNILEARNIPIIALLSVSFAVSIVILGFCVYLSRH
jgi:hypothetical protein